MNLVNNTSQKGGEIDVPVLCATVRQRVCDMLISATLAAAEKTGFKTIAVAGGVSANSELRARLKAECEKKGLTLYYPELKYCGDNAAMVGVQAYYEFKDGNTAGAELNAARYYADKLQIKGALFIYGKNTSYSQPLLGQG